MKRFITLLLVIAAFAMPAVGQNYHGKLSGPVADTFTNAATLNYILPVTGPKANVTFQYNVTKVSGTVAGVVKVFGSADGGVKYKDAPLDSFVVTNVAAQVGVYTMPTNAYTHYKVTVTTTGTQVSIFEIWGLYRAL